MEAPLSSTVRFRARLSERPRADLFVDGLFSAERLSAGDGRLELTAAQAAAVQMALPGGRGSIALLALRLDGEGSTLRDLTRAARAGVCGQGEGCSVLRVRWSAALPDGISALLGGGADEVGQAVELAWALAGDDLAERRRLLAGIIDGLPHPMPSGLLRTAALRIGGEPGLCAAVAVAEQARPRFLERLGAVHLGSHNAVVLFKQVRSVLSQPVQPSTLGAVVRACQATDHLARGEPRRCPAVLSEIILGVLSGMP